MSFLSSRLFISFALKFAQTFKDIEITDEKADIIYVALSNEIEKRSRVASLSGSGILWYWWGKCSNWA